MSTTIAATLPPAAPKAPKVKKASKPKVPASHPPYAEMIKTAVTALKERTGTSRQAILKYICANYKVNTDKVQAMVRMNIKKMIDSKTLVSGAAAGRKGAGCFKLAKPVKETIAKKPKAKKPAAATKTKAKKAKVTKKASKPKAKAASKSKAKPKSAPKKKPVVKKTTSTKKVSAAKPKKA